MKFKENKSIGNHSSFHNSTISTTVGKLEELFGKPKYDFNDGSDKVNLEWVLLLEDEVEEKEYSFTIYDWNEYRVISRNELIEWHIGGENKFSTELVKEEIEKLLNN